MSQPLSPRLRRRGGGRNRRGSAGEEGPAEPRAPGSRQVLRCRESESERELLPQFGTGAGTEGPPAGPWWQGRAPSSPASKTNELPRSAGSPLGAGQKTQMSLDWNSQHHPAPRPAPGITAQERLPGAAWRATSSPPRPEGLPFSGALCAGPPSSKGRVAPWRGQALHLYPAPRTDRPLSFFLPASLPHPPHCPRGFLSAAARTRAESFAAARCGQKLDHVQRRVTQRAERVSGNQAVGAVDARAGPREGQEAVGSLFREEILETVLAGARWWPRVPEGRTGSDGIKMQGGRSWLGSPKSSLRVRAVPQGEGGGRSLAGDRGWGGTPAGGSAQVEAGPYDPWDQAKGGKPARPP